MDWDFQLVAGPYGGTTDAPCWEGKELLFAHVGGSRLLAFDPSMGSTRELRRYTSSTRGLAIGLDGALYGCQAGVHRVVRFNADGSTSQLEVTLDGLFHNQPDDLVVDRAGRIWFSDPRDHLPGAEVTPTVRFAAVLRLERSSGDKRTIRRMTTDTKAPRGLGFSPEEDILYVAESDDSPQGVRELRAYPVQADGNLGVCRVLQAFGADHRGSHRGVDGMCIDENGDVIACAGWSRSGPGPMIYVFSPSGRILETHPCPVDWPTNCAFGDPDLTSLYVTTSEGHLFRVENCGRRGHALR